MTEKSYFNKMLSSQIKDLFKGIFSAWQHTTILMSSKNDGLCTIIVIIILFKSGFQIQKDLEPTFFLFIRWCWWKIVMKRKKTEEENTFTAIMKKKNRRRKYYIVRGSAFNIRICCMLKRQMYV